MSLAALRALRDAATWEIEWREIKRRMKGRKVLGFFTACGGDEIKSEFEFHLVFTDYTKERWDFTSRFTDTAKAEMNTFKKSFFPNVKQISLEDSMKIRRA